MAFLVFTIWNVIVRESIRTAPWLTPSAVEWPLPSLAPKSGCSSELIQVVSSSRPFNGRHKINRGCFAHSIDLPLDFFYPPLASSNHFFPTPYLPPYQVSLSPFASLKSKTQRRRLGGMRVGFDVRRGPTYRVGTDKGYDGFDSRHNPIQNPPFEIKTSTLFPFPPSTCSPFFVGIALDRSARQHTPVRLDDRLIHPAIPLLSGTDIGVPAHWTNRYAPKPIEVEVSLVIGSWTVFKSCT